MSERKDGGSVFPKMGSLYNADENLKNVFSDGGMSLRDWFAGQTLPGLVAYDPRMSDEGYEPNNVAELAYKYADALIEARDK